MGGRQSNNRETTLNNEKNYLTGEKNNLTNDNANNEATIKNLDTDLSDENLKYTNLLTVQRELNDEISKNNTYYTNTIKSLTSSLNELKVIYEKLRKKLFGHEKRNTNDTTLLNSYKNAIGPYLESQNNDMFTKNIINLTNFYQSINYENDKLNNRYNYYKNQLIRHDQKHKYYSESIDNLNILNIIMFYFFYILVLVYVGVLYLYKPDWSIYFRIFIIILLACYPYVVFTIETFLYNLWIMIYSMLTGSVYNNLSYSQKVVLNNTTDLTTGDY